MVFELQTARRADLPTLGLLCEIKADIRSLEAAIRTDGHTIQAGSGGRKAHPALASLAAARQQAQILLDIFGLVPGSKTRQAKKFNAHDHKIYYGN